MKKVRQVHFVGIGGIGMSGIAEVLLNLGYGVTGSDLVSGPATRRLAVLGGRVTVGHSPQNVEGADVVVISSAVRADNVEVMEARRRQIPVIPRDARRADAHEVRRRHCRFPWENLHHLHGGPNPLRLRPRSHHRHWGKAGNLG